MKKGDPKQVKKQRISFPKSFQQFKQQRKKGNIQAIKLPTPPVKLQKKKQPQISKKPNIIQKQPENIQKKIDDKKQQINNKPKSKISLKHPNAIPIKIVFLGDGNSGKTSALISYTSNKFNQDYVPTIFDTYESLIKRGNTQIKLQLWDTAGQQQYKKLRSLSYPKTDIFFICFSMIDKKSFANAIQKWYSEVKQNCPKTEVIFVGTKIDLKSEYENNTQLKKQMTKSYSEFMQKQKIQKKITSMGYKLMTISAVTQEGLFELFDTAIDKILQKKRNKGEIVKKTEEIDCQII